MIRWDAVLPDGLKRAVPGPAGEASKRFVPLCYTRFFLSSRH